MVDQVESEPFSTAESRRQTQFGPNWSNLPLPVMRTECVNECIGDMATPENTYAFSNMSCLNSACLLTYELGVDKA